MRKPLLLWPLLLSYLLLSGCSPQSEQSAYLYEQKKLEGQAIGTTYTIIYLDGDKPLEPTQLEQEFNVLLNNANQSMSTYHRNSEISAFNRLLSAEPMNASPTLLKVVQEGIRLNEMTDGALDITLKPLSAIWGFGPDKKPHTIPSQSAIEAVLAKTGVDKLTLTTTTIAKSVPDLELDLNTIGKGFLVDETAQLLERHNITNYMVEIGGEMRTKGHNGRGTPWRIGVVNPTGGVPKAQRAVYPGNNGIATSGDYYQYFEENGVRYSHILDPSTGKPIGHKLASVTVFHPSSMTADGLATAIMVMGAEKGLALAKKHNLAIYLIIRDGDKFVSKMSPAFEPYLDADKVAKMM